METVGKQFQAARQLWIIAIIIISTAVAIIVVWRVPGLNLAARDGLVRARGTLAVPDDIVIVAIDEASIKRYGRFPWARSLTAKTLDVIAAAHLKVIALDVLYSEPTNVTDDTALVTSIAQAGNVVTASQLIEINDGERRVVWLRPLPEIEKAAACCCSFSFFRILLLRAGC